MARRPCVLYVNLRRIPREGYGSLLAARRLGFDVVMIARSVPEWARPLVADVALVDTFDAEASLDAARELARRHDVRGVANWTEVDVALVTRVADALGLPGIPPDAATPCRNKFAMKQALAHLDGVLPRFARVTNLDELTSAVDSIGFPAVVKPTGASGSKGIFELHGRDDLAPAIARLQEIARPEFDAVFRQYGAEFIVEEFLTGDEISVEGFVAAGRVEVVGLTDKVTTPGFHLEVRHVFPSRLPDDRRRGIVDVVERIVLALGMDHCSFHLEGKVTADGFRFIEVAARPAGDYIASHVVPAATGVDYLANVVRVAVGLPLDVAPTRSLHSGVRFLFAGAAGRLRGLDGLEHVLEHPAFDHAFLEVAADAEILLPPEHFGLQRVAAVVATHPEHAAVVELLEEAARRVVPHVEPAGTTA